MKTENDYTTQELRDGQWVPARRILATSELTLWQKIIQLFTGRVFKSEDSPR